jgi:hypothetical protein
MNNIIKKFTLSAVGAFLFAVALAMGCIFLIAYDGTGSSYRETKIIVGKVAGVIALYIIFPICIALAKNIVLLILDIGSQQSFSVVLDLNRNTELNFPKHTFYIVGMFNRIIPIPCGIFWTLAFSRSYYLLSEDTMKLSKNYGQNKSAQVIVSKYAHVILTIDNQIK